MDCIREASRVESSEPEQCRFQGHYFVTGMLRVLGDSPLAAIENENVLCDCPSKTCGLIGAIGCGVRIIDRLAYLD